MYFNDTVGTAEGAATAVATLWTGLETWLSDGLAWTVEPEIDEVNPTTGQITGAETWAGDTGTGDDAAERLPNATQLLVRSRSGVYINGRERRGRIFIPGMIETQSLQGKPASGLCDAVQALFNGFQSDGGYQPVVWSREAGQFAPISSYSVWRTEFAVLRSRRD